MQSGHSGEAKVWRDQAIREAAKRSAALARDLAREKAKQAEEKLREEALARLREENAGAAAQAQQFEVSLP